MRAGIVVQVTRADRRRLEAIVADRGAPQKHVWRAHLVATADGCGTAEIMRRSGKAKPVVWTWQARFMAEGVAGLLRDKTRKPGKPPLASETVQRVVDLALGPPPGEATHWSGRELAKAVGVSLHSGATHPGSSSARAASDADVQAVEGARNLPRSSGTSSAFMSILRLMPSSSRSMRRAKSRRSTAPSPACR